MEGNMYKKALVVGIIILFLGLSIQPTLGTELPVTREIEFNEDIEECEPCKLVELLKNYKELKYKGMKITNINNKLNSIKKERLICGILDQLITFNLFAGFTYVFIFATLQEVAPLVYNLLEDFFNSTLESIAKRFRYYCGLYEDVYDCGSLKICPPDT